MSGKQTFVLSRFGDHMERTEPGYVAGEFSVPKIKRAVLADLEQLALIISGDPL
jgi:hypothetical protein